MPPSKQRAWHERFGLLGWFRRRLRNVLYRMVRQMAATDDDRDLLIAALDGAHAGRHVRPEGLDVSGPSPY